MQLLFFVCLENIQKLVAVPLVQHKTISLLLKPATPPSPCSHICIIPLSFISSLLISSATELNCTENFFFGWKNFDRRVRGRVCLTEEGIDASHFVRRTTAGPLQCLMITCRIAYVRWENWEGFCISRRSRIHILGWFS